MKQKRFTRTNDLSDSQRRKLVRLIQTPGFTRAGNRVRIAITLPPDVAAELAKRMLSSGQTGSEIISEMLKPTTAEV